MKFKIPIYFGSLDIVVSDNFNESCKKHKINTENHDIDTYTAFSYRAGANKYLLFVRKETRNSEIAHEAVHIANFILADIWAKPDLHNDEHQAYLVGWVVEQVEKAMENIGKQKIRQ